MADPSTGSGFEAFREEGGRCACFNLRRVTRAVTQLYDDALRPTGLRSTQITVLVALSRAQPVTIQRLAASLVVDRTTLTRNLRPLQEAGLVRVERGSDRRVREIVLTPAGERKIEEAFPRWRRAQQRIEGGLGPERFACLLDELTQTLGVVAGDEA